MSFLGPEFLVRQIGVISLVISAVLLVVFGDFVDRTIVFPIADLVRSKTQSSLKKHTFAKYFPEFLATAVFILYCYFGSSFLSEYVFAPILSRLSNILLVVLVILFFALSYLINNLSLRRKILKS
jgi:hypothetical protein